MMFREKIDLLSETEQKMLTLIYLSQNNDGYLTEADLHEGIKDWFKKIGMNIDKNPSIFDYMDSFVSGVGTIILAAIQGDKAKIKAQAQRFDVEELIDFIDLLDNITLGIISTPLSLIQAVTGWDIMSGIRNSIQNTKKIVKDVKSAVANIRQKISKIISGNQLEPVQKAIDTIDGSIPNAETITVKGK